VSISRTAPASTNVRSTASTRASGCSTSTPTSAWTAPVCPVEAIFYEDDTPEEWKDYYDANVHFFDDLGSPGGAAKMGEIDKDHPLIEALPPQEHDE
jgi:hypothetical protein